MRALDAQLSSLPGASLGADANGCPMLPAEMSPSHVKYLMDEGDTEFDLIIDVRAKIEFDGIGGEGADDVAKNKIGRMSGGPGSMMSLSVTQDLLTLQRLRELTWTWGNAGAILVENLSPANVTFLENIKCKTAKILIVCASGT